MLKESTHRKILFCEVTIIVKQDAKRYKYITGNDRFIENANFQHQFLLND